MTNEELVTELLKLNPKAKIKILSLDSIDNHDLVKIYGEQDVIIFDHQ